MLASAGMELRGVLAALTTPFSDGEVCLDALYSNLQRYECLALGGYLLLGSTGEALLLEEQERCDLLERAREAIPASKPLIVGVTAESTRGAVRQAARLADLGADAALVSTPHYFRAQMTSAALAHHFQAIADGSPVPVLLYNVPKFTGLSIPVDVVCGASRHENVVGLKDSSGDLEYLGRVLAGSRPGFRVLCGDAPVLRDALAAGAAGAILAAATFMPEPLIDIAAGGRPPSDDLREVVAAAKRVTGRFGVSGIKAAVDLRGLQGGSVRSPLVPLEAQARREIERLIVRLVDRGILPRREL